MKTAAKLLALLLALCLTLSACTPAEPPVNEEQQGQQNQQGESGEKDPGPGPEPKDFTVPDAVYKKIESEVRGTRENNTGYKVLNIELEAAMETDLCDFEEMDGSWTAKARRVTLEVYDFDAAWLWDGEWSTTEGQTQKSMYVFEKTDGEYLYLDRLSTTKETVETDLQKNYGPPEEALLRDGYHYWAVLGQEALSIVEGEPLQTKEHYGYGYTPGDRIFQYIWDGIDASFYVSYKEDGTIQTKALHYLYVTTPDISTPRGIRIGSTKAELLQAYPDIYLQDDGTYCYNSSGLYEWYPTMGLVFHLNNDRVSKICLVAGVN